MNKNKHTGKKRSFMRIPALVLALILPVIMVFSAALVIQAGIRMDSAEDLKTKDYFQTSAFADSFYSKASTILSGISAREILDKTNEDAYIDLGELYNGDSLSFKNTSGLAYSFNDLKEWSSQTIHSNDSWIVLSLTTPEGETKYMYYSDFKKALEDGTLQLNANSGALKYEGISQKDWTERILSSLSAEYADGGIQSQEPLKNITDKNGNVVYTDVADMLTPILDIPCAPEGYDSLLDYMNSTSSKTRNFKGNLNDAFEQLDNARDLFSSWTEAAQTLDEYSSDNSNIHYAYTDNTSQKIFTNTDAAYTSDLTDISGFSAKKPYVFLSVNEAATDEKNARNGLMNLNLSAAANPSVGNWIDLLRNSTYDENCSFLAWIDDTSLPVQDSIKTDRQHFLTYRTLFIPATVIAMISFLLFIIDFIWLTVHTGRRNSDSGNTDTAQPELNFFDRIYTEAAAGLVCIPALGVLTAGLSMQACTYNLVSSLIILGITIFLITCLFWIGYLSLIRRIKARTLWKNSLLRKCLKLPRLCLCKAGKLIDFFSRNTISRIRMVVGLGVFLFLEFFFSALLAASDGWFLMFLLLFLLDLGALFCVYKIALGRELLLDGLKRITDGELTYKIPEKELRGDQKAMAQYINRIGDGLDAAVEKSLKDERMKTELITNVSHDLKTPLTSIINYIDLLKRLNLKDPEALKYLEILDSKAHRLKSLTEDVVEASKASTGNLSLEMTELNFVEMLYQVMGEFEERMKSRHLTLMTHLPDSPAMIYADGRRMWRILENLFGNILKYAMENTRVYAEVLLEKDQVIFTLKNISAQPLNIPAEELTERFIRGDVARNTEGSGLGLSIAQSLTQLQGGTFNLYLDGDLFKVCLSFPQKISPTALSSPEDSHSETPS